MSMTVVKGELALDSPLRWTELEQYRTGTLDYWKRLFFEDGFTSETLPRAFDESGDLIEENTVASKEILSHAGGLVVAGYRGDLLPFDQSVLLHMDQAADAGIPVFVQTPYEEVIEREAGRLPGEVISMKLGQHAEITERLGEQLW